MLFVLFAVVLLLREGYGEPQNSCAEQAKCFLVVRDESVDFGDENGPRPAYCFKPHNNGEGSENEDLQCDKIFVEGFPDTTGVSNAFVPQQSDHDIGTKCEDLWVDANGDIMVGKDPNQEPAPASCYCIPEIASCAEDEFQTYYFVAKDGSKCHDDDGDDAEADSPSYHGTMLDVSVTDGSSCNGGLIQCDNNAKSEGPFDLGGPATLPGDKSANTMKGCLWRYRPCCVEDSVCCDWQPAGTVCSEGAGLNEEIKNDDAAETSVAMNDVLVAVSVLCALFGAIACIFGVLMYFKNAKKVKGFAVAQNDPELEDEENEEEMEDGVQLQTKF